MRRLQTPLVWLPLTAILVADAVQLAKYTRDSSCATVLRRALDLLPPGGGGRTNWVDRGYARFFVETTATGYSFHHSSEYTVPTPSSPLATVDYRPISRREGFWALTYEFNVESVEVTVLDPSNIFSAEQPIRDAFFAAHPELSYLAPGPHRATRVLWPAVEHDAATAAAGALWVGSLPWLWTWRPRRRRERRRFAAGLCHKCGYDLRSGGLAACPECGWGRA